MKNWWYLLRENIVFVKLVWGLVMKPSFPASYGTVSFRSKGSYVSYVIIIAVFAAIFRFVYDLLVLNGPHGVQCRSGRDTSQSLGRISYLFT